MYQLCILNGVTRLKGISQMLSFLRWEHSGHICLMKFRSDNVQHSFMLQLADPAFGNRILAYVPCEVVVLAH